MHIVFVVVFTLVGGLGPGSNLLALSVVAVGCSWLFTIITAYLITSNGSVPRQKKHAGSLSLGQSTGIICTCLYLVPEM